jgi:hypothetical protein
VATVRAWSPKLGGQVESHAKCLDVTATAVVVVVVTWLRAICNMRPGHDAHDLSKPDPSSPI